MAGYHIGISGFDAVRRALDVIGNNIVNAATDGYHRQRINLTPAYASQVGSVMLAGGVDVAGVTRMIDVLLEQQIFQQQSSLGQVSQELATLRTVESAWGELSGGGLSTVIDQFFTALQDLCAHPTEAVWQSQAANAAETMAGQFRTLGEFLTRLDTQIQLEAQNTIAQINVLINQIAELNGKIERIEIGGKQANNLRDQRDRCISELSKLISIETQTREYGVVDVSVAGISVVVGSSTVELEAGLKEDGSLGISVAGAFNTKTDVQGGKLGGLLSLKNNILASVQSDLNSLASAIIMQINQYHVQGVGSEGSFSELLGWQMPSENLADFEPPVTNGAIYIRVVNTDTGEITRHKIDVDASTDSLTTIATKISAITGLTASAASSRLHIQAEANYKFDFLPCVLPEPTASNLTAPSPPNIAISGIYTGTENQTFQFTVVGTGSVGNGNLQLEVKNGIGQVVTTVNIGDGYAAGDKLDIADGIKISITTGDLNAGDTFEVDAFASTDTSAVLSAAGINTFFSGSSATNMAVCSDISAKPGRIATALGAEMTDNTNILRMADLKDESLSSLGNVTAEEFHRQLVTAIGQQIYLRQIREDNGEIILQNLTNQQGQISGVDVNEEAAQMLIFEQMFRAMSKYLNTVQSSILSIMEII